MTTTQVATTPTEQIRPNPMVAICNTCPWEGNRFTAGLHESDIPGHRVSVWVRIGSETSPGELYPRFLWDIRVTFPQAS